MIPHLRVLALLLFGLALLNLLAEMPGAAQGSVNASVSVICPFNRALNVHPLYVLSSNITFNYSLNTAVDCTIPAINGSLIIWPANSTPSNSIFSNSLEAFNISTSKQTYNISIDKSIFKAGGYYVNVSFKREYYKENSSAPVPFEAISYANVIIANSAVSSVVTLGSPVSITDNITNIGEISSTPNTVLHVKILGPSYASTNNYTIGPIKAGGSLLNTLLLYSASPNTGSYTVTQNVTYYYNYTINGVL
ncbi:MAG: hypothetical protein QXR58_00430, partial [Candidatus Micrarchaeaceae archaeon]